MADQKVTLDAAGCLGRVLTVLGFIWIGIVALGGMGLLAELGFSGEFLAGVGGTIVPGLLLLFAGRSLSRRVAKTQATTVAVPGGAKPPVAPASRVPTSRPKPAQQAPIPISLPAEEKPPPRSVVKPAPSARPIPEPTAETGDAVEEPLSMLKDPAAFLPSGSSRPKTSQEMIDEARKKWGTGKTS